MRAETERILEARDAGDLPAGIRLDVSRTNLVIHMPSIFPADLDAAARALALAEQLFPGGRTLRGHCLVRAKRGRPAVDRIEYRSHAEAGLVQLWAMGPHEHRDHYGRMEGGKPVWRCGGCRGRITVTDARALGLLPPREKPAPKPRQRILPGL